MLTPVIVFLLILWLLGYFGPKLFSGFPNSGSLIHVLLVIVAALVILFLLHVI